ncbi:MAG: TraR/DksA C4-type zinc finger protein [Pseudorhodobacter sp.]|nr:TraR/DksA C4-type zinc finger protein [Pseudorhodobacter sp.]
MMEPTAEDLRRHFTPLLQAELASLRDATRNTSADRRPVELDQGSVGRLSRMDAMQGQAMAAAVDSRRQARMRAIEAALVRLQGDDFGWCGVCGEFIGLRRLNLDPTVQRCVGCKH